jgi:tetratricopeptide (TPR) repeat protein
MIARSPATTRRSGLIRDGPSPSQRGYTYSVKEEYDLAIADFDMALRLDPTFAVAYAGRCGAWNGKGQYDRAIADCEEAMKLNPKLANAHSHRGFAYGMKGNFDRAMTDLDKAIVLNPRYARGYSYLRRDLRTARRPRPGHRGL